MSIRHASSIAAFIVVLASSLGLATPARAGSSTGNFQVTATVVSACTVSAATLNFGGSIDPTSASLPINATTTMTVLCTSTTPYSLALNAGANAGGASNFSARAMKNGTRTLGYQLYLDSLYTTVWGDGTTASSVLPGVGLGTNQTINIYGRLPSLTGAVPGTYTDTVTVTVSY